MANLPRAEALFGSSPSSSIPGETYTNPYGNYTVVDTVTEDMLDLVHPHWYGFPPMNEMWYGLVAFFLSCMATLAISGNFIVLYVFSCTKALRSPSNYFVVNLALSDFILMFCMCPPLVINSYYHTWVFGPFWCQVYGAIGSLTGCTSIFTMVCISFDRYNVIVKGIGGKPLTTGNALAQIAIVWLTSAVWTFVPFFGWGRYIPEGNMTACGTDYLSEDILTVSYLYAYAAWVWLVPLLMIVYCYWYIVAAVSAHEKAMKEQAKKMGVKSLRGDQDAQKKSADCKLAKVALVTVSLWFMAWTPYLVINMAGLIDKSAVTPLFSIWGSVFAKANTVYNPIVYAISHPKYKTALYQKLPWLQCATESADSDSKSTASNATTDCENKA
ncbi:rhodopsin-like [Penaeus japonicus]|uniref:rhodopsin-like n=1 Tax=Penaeus japonicus TaxID=27405 RepID=UPI001C70D686|nr:rhodopsin-like [Penaeus japonicus]